MQSRSAQASAPPRTEAQLTSPSILGSGTALPRHHYDQRQLADIARRVLPELGMEGKVIERFFSSVGVKERYLALPAEEYQKLSGFGARNEAFREVALDLAEKATRAALHDSGIDASEVKLFMSTTVTGLSVPSIEARLMNRMPFPISMKRMPLFGLGCLAGAAGVARVAEYLRAFPSHVAMLLSVELCSLTVQRGDGSLANLISSGLFGDGAAAVVLAGADHARAAVEGPQVLDSQSVFFPGTERVMGWDVVDTGFKIVLSRDVPAIARNGVPALVDRLLRDNGLSRSDIEAWVVHPGGPAVMEGLRLGLELAPEQLEPTKRSLAEVGNLSSASVLFLLHEYRRVICPKPGSYGVMIAMGPAFCAEAVLLKW